MKRCVFALAAVVVAVPACLEDLSCGGDGGRKRELSRGARGVSPVDFGEGEPGRRRGARGERDQERPGAARGAAVSRERTLAGVADAGFASKEDPRRRVGFKIITPTSKEAGGCSFFEKGKVKPTHARSLAEVPIEYRDEAVCATSPR